MKREQQIHGKFSTSTLFDLLSVEPMKPWNARAFNLVSDMHDVCHISCVDPFIPSFSSQHSLLLFSFCFLWFLLAWARPRCWLQSSLFSSLSLSTGCVTGGERGLVPSFLWFLVALTLLVLCKMTGRLRDLRWFVCFYVRKEKQHMLECFCKWNKLDVTFHRSEVKPESVWEEGNRSKNWWILWKIGCMIL